MTKVQKRLKILEQVAMNAKPFLGLQAVDHIISIKPAEARVASLLNLVTSSSEDVRNKVNDYLSSYKEFIIEVNEKYPSLANEETKGVSYLFKCDDAASKKDLDSIVKIGKDSGLLKTRIGEQLKSSIEMFVAFANDDSQSLEKIAKNYQVNLLSPDFLVRNLNLSKFSYETLFVFSRFLLQNNFDGSPYFEKTLDKQNTQKQLTQLAELVGSISDRTIGRKLQEVLYSREKIEAEKIDRLKLICETSQFDDAFAFSEAKALELAKPLSYPSALHLGKKLYAEGILKNPIDFYVSCIEKDATLQNISRVYDVVSEQKLSCQEFLTRCLQNLTDSSLKERIQERYAKEVGKNSIWKKLSTGVYNGKVKKIGNMDYALSAEIVSGDFCDVYSAIRKNDGEKVLLKISREASDNELLKNEYNVLTSIDPHHSLPVILASEIADGKRVNIFKPIESGFDLVRFKEMFPNGLDAEHGAWILERLLAVTGYLHNSQIVHGNIEPANVIVTPHNHDAILLDYVFAVPDAMKNNARYRGINDYSAPEIDKKIRVHPSSDIYSLGKTMVYLLGGDVKELRLPSKIDSRFAEFIQEFLIEDYKIRRNDAYQTCKDLRELRNEIWPNRKFVQLNLTGGIQNGRK
jgi:RIO-like serine/threonine protein kinase